MLVSFCFYVSFKLFKCCPFTVTAIRMVWAIIESFYFLYFNYGTFIK